MCVVGFSVIPSHLSHDVDGTHQQLVQMPVHHDLGAVHQGVLKTCPDLVPQLVGDVEFDTEVPQANTS